MASTGQCAIADCLILMVTLLAVVLPQDGFTQNVPEEASSFDSSAAEYYEPPTVREAADDVFRSPEFRNLPRLNLGPDGKDAEPLKPKKEEEQAEEVQVRAPSAGSALLSNLFGGAISIVVVAVLAVLLGAIIALIVLGVKRWERAEKEESQSDSDAATDDEADPTISPGEKPADAWLAAAREAAAAGRFDEALALLLLGTMSHAERAGLIRPRRGLTYRDYLRAVPRNSAWHPALSGLIQSYAPVGFGRRKATATAFQTAVGPYEQALSLEPTPDSVRAAATLES